MNIIETIIEIIFTPSLVWVGALTGIIIAVLAWYYLPETANKSAIAAWAIGLGFVIGWAFTLNSEKEK